jgi:ABC-type Fe3+/spermidine/putrescine transport system ATPase subunit
MPPALLEVRGLAVDVPDRGQPRRVLDGIDLDIAAGEMLVLVGPSGCGKTTLLRTLAGLLGPAGGSVLIAGRDQRGVPPHARGTSLVLDTPALVGHLSVRRNVALAVRPGTDPVLARDSVDTALATLDLLSLEDRLPSELSTGQAHRVALARALVGRPRLLLLDEPLAHVDPLARAGLARQVLAVHRRLHCASLHVTHDLGEALSMADRIAVMRDGHLVQVDTPRAIWNRPASTWVASRTGTPNVLRAPLLEVVDDPEPTAVVEILGSRHLVPCPATGLRAPGTCLVCAHGDAVRILGPDDSGEADLVGEGAQVLSVRFGGDHVDYELETDEATLVARTPPEPRARAWHVGERVRVALVDSLAWAVPR